MLSERELIAEYAVECSIPEIGEINPSPEMYAAMERAGILKIFGAFHAEQLVGFASVLITVLPHYSKKVCTLESIFVLRSMRIHGLGTELMQAVKRYAKEEGCQAILYSAPSGGRLEKVLNSDKRTRCTSAIFCQKL